MSRAGAKLAAHLEQRNRIGEPALIPERMDRAAFLRALAPAEPAGAEGPGRARRAPRAAAASVDASDRGYEALKREAEACTRCRLSSGRTNVVFGAGARGARLAVVGEAPGADEDASGVPFVGRAGRMLDLMLASVGFSRGDTAYICNVVKCRPPGNRNPEPDEIEACAPFLRRQIELVAPEVLLAVGAFAARWLTSSEGSLGRLRGRVHRYRDVPLIVTYHPSALLRNFQWNRAAWEDLQLLRRVADGAR